MLKTQLGSYLSISNGQVVTSKKPVALLLEPLKSAPITVNRRVMISNKPGLGNPVDDIMDQILALEDNECGELESPLFNRITSRNNIEFEFDDT